MQKLEEISSASVGNIYIYIYIYIYNSLVQTVTCKVFLFPSIITYHYDKGFLNLCYNILNHNNSNDWSLLKVNRP
jgi:hypothetical protein